MKAYDRLDGLKVRDARKPIDIHVTEDNTRKGRPNDSCGCAFVVAIKRITGAKQARVQASRLCIEQNGIYRRYRVPGGVLGQLTLFDRTGDMGEGVYTSPVVSPSNALGLWHGGIDHRTGAALAFASSQA